MSSIPVTFYLPDDLWRAVPAPARHEGDINTIVLRVLEEYVTATAKPRANSSGKYDKLVKVLSTPVEVLYLSARVATRVRQLHIRTSARWR
jgi:hypothetical protein